MNDLTAIPLTALVLGGTGRTGRCAIDQLTARGVRVRAIVRAADRVPEALRARPNLELIEASLLDLDDEALTRHVRGADVVVSCLGHTLSFKGLFGRPRDLVTRAMRRVVAAIRRVAPARQVRVLLMTSVSVNRPARADRRRGSFQRAFMAVLRFLLPPAKDNQRAADFLVREVGASDPHVGWVVIRPDSLIDGPPGDYTLHEALVDSLFAPGRTTMNNIGHFMAALATEDTTWSQWRGKLPVIVNPKPSERVAAARPSRA